MSESGFWHELFETIRTAFQSKLFWGLCAFALAIAAINFGWITQGTISLWGDKVVAGIKAAVPLGAP